MTALCVALALSTPGWNGADLVASIAIFVTWVWWSRKHQQAHD